MVNTKFKTGGLHEKHVVATWNLGEPSQHLLIDTGKPRKTCVEMAGRRTLKFTKLQTLKNTSTGLLVSSPFKYQEKQTSTTIHIR